MRVCPTCGAENADTATSCDACGRTLGPSVPSDPRVGGPADATPLAPPSPTAAADTSIPPPTPATRPEPFVLPPGSTDPPGSLASIIDVVERSGRGDLSTGLRQHRDELGRIGVTIAVVGEFKKGKSTLVNALVNAEVCPADPVYASIAPVTVRHGESGEVTATFADGRRETAPLEGAAIARVASEEGNEDNHLGLVHVEVAIPRRLLAAGLHLVDLPGVGGLDSAIGALNLASLEAVDGVLLVTDCTQELTGPELSFAVAARARCQPMVCVMTKADIQHRTASITARNREHLDANGLADVPLHAVSSVLHLVALAQGDPVLEEESGFATLFETLHTQIWEPCRRHALAAAGRRLADLADHVALPIEVEQQARRSPAEAERIIARLSELEDRVRQLRSASAPWQQRLAEGANDIAGELESELRERLRAVARLAEARTETEAGDDLVHEAWMHKATMDQVLGHYDRIGERMSALSDDIAAQFVVFDPDASLPVRIEAPASRLAELSVARDAPVVKDGLVRRLVTTSQGYSSGMVLTSSLFGFFAGPFLLVPVVTVPIAGLMARRAFVDDRDRRADVRRAELKRSSARYLDEVASVLYTDSRRAVEHVHRQLLVHYAERAERLERTVGQARVAAEHARRGATDGGGSGGAAALDGDAAAVEQLRSAAVRLVADASADVSRRTPPASERTGDIGRTGDRTSSVA